MTRGGAKQGQGLTLHSGSPTSAVPVIDRPVANRGGGQQRAHIEPQAAASDNVSAAQPTLARPARWGGQPSVIMTRRTFRTAWNEASWKSGPELPHPSLAKQRWGRPVGLVPITVSHHHVTIKTWPPTDHLHARIFSDPPYASQLFIRKCRHPRTGRKILPPSAHNTPIRAPAEAVVPWTNIHRNMHNRPIRMSSLISY